MHEDSADKGELREREEAIDGHSTQGRVSQRQEIRIAREQRHLDQVGTEWALSGHLLDRAACKDSFLARSQVLQELLSGLEAHVATVSQVPSEVGHIELQDQIAGT